MAERPPINEPQTGLEMNLPARAENVAVVRHALAGLAEELGMDEAGVADLKTVVTEACMNVAVHAYEGRPGAMYVEAYPDEDGLTVTVRDSGVGIRPRPETEPTSLRLGLSLIAALSSNFVFSGGLNRGTEIRMHLPLHGGGADVGGPPVEVPEDNEETEISIGRTDLLAPVLARVVGALAARQDVSIDRLSDAVLVTDALSDVAPGHFADGHVQLALADSTAGVELRLGPMEQGGAEEIRRQLELPAIGGLLDSLADDLSVRAGEDGDYLAIRFSSAAPAP